MSNVGVKLQSQWRDAVNFVLAVWLFLSPWILAYAGSVAAAWNAWVIAIVVAVAAAAAFIAFHKWEEWVNAVLGVWLIVSPWILGFGALTAAVWNQVVVGALVLILAVWAAFSEQETGQVAPKT